MASVIAKPYSGKILSFDGYHVDGLLADGEGVIVYVMDSGHNPDPYRITRQEIFFPGKVEFPQQDGDVKSTQSSNKARDIVDDSFKGKEFKVEGQRTGPKVRDVTASQHGPSISALIGASKEDSPEIEACIKSCQTILDYHRKMHAGKPAIINCSFGITYNGVFTKLKYLGVSDELLEGRTVSLIFDFQAAVEKLINAGMILVAGAGNQQETLNASWAEWKVNDGKKLKSDPTFRAPQSFNDVIVVGGLNRDGELWKGSGTGKLVSHYLLADDVENPNNYYFYDNGKDKETLMEGTSIATAFLSGIIACILSSRKYAPRARLGGDDVQKRIRQILEKVSTGFVDGKGNKCRAFKTGTLDLKKVI